VAQYPDGDLAAEGFWRLAWTAYLAGDTETAIAWAEQMIAQVPVETSPMHWMGAHYWSARWRIYPSVDDPTTKSSDEDDVAVGISLLLDLCERYPSRFYSLLGAARLYELVPERVSQIERPAPAGHPSVWTVRDDFLSEVAVQHGLQLARLGLISEAMLELNSLPQAALLPSEVALITEVERELDWTGAHDRLHKYLLHHPAAELGPDRDRILREAFPDSYWEVIVEVSEGYRYDPRIFHSLVREESSFNPKIVSWAGARGLSQLMPATARQVAGWLGISISDSKMFDPKTNLAIGTRYLDYLHGLFSNNHMLSVAGYNAGEGNVQKWVRRHGNIPTDEFIESIPFRETRRYVKRVLGTYQLYTMVYGDDVLYADWSRLNHQSIPD
jgi:soluble lytic murein transglycosylase